MCVSESISLFQFVCFYFIFILLLYYFLKVCLYNYEREKEMV